ncbi:hypothetical protein ACXL2M_001912, partial [Campylobacter jejuni]
FASPHHIGLRKPPKNIKKYIKNKKIRVRVRARENKKSFDDTLGRGLVRSLSLGKLHAPAAPIIANYCTYSVRFAKLIRISYK